MQSHSQKNADTHICHHCGAENARIPELWISSMGDGHFYIIAEVNGTPIMFLADTGASHIVLSPADAEKLGIEKLRS
jgi:predicted aspartyl protease